MARGVRHFVTYYDQRFVSYASMSISSFIATNDFDRLTVLLPDDGGSSKEYAAVANSASFWHHVDRRIVPMSTGSLPKFSEAGNASLQEGHPQLFTDILRSCLFATFQEPIIWFDSDMIFLEDISDLIEQSEPYALAAAPDMSSLSSESPGARLYRAFVEHVSGRPDGTSLVGTLPVNCGLLSLRADLSESFHAGLGHAIRFLEVTSGMFADESAEKSILRHSLGQLAWNYVFHTSKSMVASSCYNWVCDEDPAGVEADPNARILHYVGVMKKWRMAFDYARLFGRRRGRWAAPGATRDG